MGINTGAASLNINIIDNTTTNRPAIKGLTAVIGETKLGEIGKPYTAGSWSEFLRRFGGLIADSDFPFYCQRALGSDTNPGAPLIVVPVGHYTNIANPATLQGTKATDTLTQLAVSETLATATVTVTAAGVAGNTIQILSFENYDKDLGTYTVGVAPTTTSVAAGIAAAIQAGTGTHGYTASAALAVVTITAPAGSGATANDFILSSEIVGTVAATLGSFMSGVTEADAGTLTVTAKSVQDGYNGIVIEVTAPVIPTADTVDITVFHPESTSFNEVYRNVPTAPTQDQLDALSAQSYIVDFTSSTGVLPVGSLTLAGGGYTIGNITSTDYLGNQVAKTGIYAFDDVSGFSRIAIPHKQIPALDAAISAYTLRPGKGFQSYHWAPSNNPDLALDYRNGTGVYSHQPLNTARSRMFFGNIKVLDPLTGLYRFITGMGDMLANRARVDRELGEWQADAQEPYGFISDAIALEVDLGTPGYATKLDQLINAGLNPIIKRNGFIRLWANKTLQIAATKQQSDGVAGLLRLYEREFPALVDSSFFKSNIPPTWRLLYYNKVRPFNNDLGRRGAFNADNAGTGKPYGWDWRGDQDATFPTQYVVNSPANVDSGQYKAQLRIKPVNSLEWINVDVILTPTDISFEEAA